MSAFMVNSNVMTKVLTAILLNLDTFDGESTFRTALLAAPTDAQKEAGTKIGRKLFLMNGRALSARYRCSGHSRLPEFVFEKWADASPVEQFKPTLLEIFPDPQDLLALKPEELAGILLIEFVPDTSESDHGFRFAEIKAQVEKSYPRGRGLHEIVLALTEALSWLTAVRLTSDRLPVTA
jgi:hypothetical protein